MVPMTTIRYERADLQIHDFLEPLWPEIDLYQWPTFCGAGNGFGDWVVSDEICGVKVACCCFIHDIDWALCADTWSDFWTTNKRFYNNVKNIVLANYDKEKYSQFVVKYKCFCYFLAVCTFGRAFFKKSNDEKKVTSNPYKHPVVRHRLHRLAMSTLDRLER